MGDEFWLYTNSLGELFIFTHRQHHPQLHGETCPPTHPRATHRTRTARPLGWTMIIRIPNLVALILMTAAIALYFLR